MIEVYNNILTEKECKKIISLFENDSNKHPGLIGSGQFIPRYKNSIDVNQHFSQESEYNKILYPGVNKAITKYFNKYQFLMDHAPWEICEDYNIQKYNDGDGYFSLHAEDGFNLNRVMAWMVYLNTCKCGTEFPYQNTVTEAIEGSCVVWPASWTHPHKGVTPNLGEKYIATGWTIYT